MKATLPGFGTLSKNVALRLVLGLIIPIQFGPIILMLYCLANSIIFSSKAFPSAPISLKPAETIIAPFIPAFPHSSTTPGTVDAGVAIIAKSHDSGTAITVG